MRIGTGTSKRVTTAIAGAICVAALTACDDHRPPGSGPRPPPSATVPVASGSASGPQPIASAQAAEPDPRVGRWTATYRAARAVVEIPPGLPAKTWQRDDGSSASGEGRIELSIDKDGQARGSAEGPLGKLALRGIVDGDSLRVGVSPQTPTEEPAFAGLLVAALAEGLFVGELRVSSGDGTIVRSAPVRLARPAPSGAEPQAASATAGERP
jgi:hypothetical protein